MTWLSTCIVEPQKVGSPNLQTPEEQVEKKNICPRWEDLNSFIIYGLTMGP